MPRRIALALLLLAACDNKGKTGSGEPGRVGAKCDLDADCESGLFCEIRLPGGACTKECLPCPANCSTACEVGCDAGEPSACVPGCIPATQERCPEGAQCVNVHYFVNGQKLGEVRCLAECDLTKPCRQDKPYTCVTPNNADFQVCIPQ